MYYPYLRGRQFELIALREYASSLRDNNYVTPIIEPVKKTFNSMRLALPKLIEGRVKFALIMNPNVGEIKGPAEVIEGLGDLLEDITKWIPAFIVTNNYSEVDELIELLNYKNVMIFCSGQSDANNVDFKKLVSSDNVKYVVSEENRTLKRFINDKGKELIRLDDNFKGEKRNSDYLNLDEEKFSEEHFYYLEDNYKGFSDYTTLVSEFIEGGGAPYAVAIHLTYEKSKQEIWIRHFTSVSNFDRANIQGKFSQAANKAVKFLDEKEIHTEASEELRTYVSEAKYPGLGMVKKIAIKHHLQLLNELIKA